MEGVQPLGTPVSSSLAFPFAIEVPRRISV